MEVIVADLLEKRRSALLVLQHTSPSSLLFLLLLLLPLLPSCSLLLPSLEGQTRPPLLEKICHDHLHIPILAKGRR